MRSKLFIPTIILSLSLSSASAQERIWTKQTKISEVMAFEKEINPNVNFFSQNVSLSKDYYPLSDKYQVTMPLIVQRQPVKYLPVNAEYFYTPADSVLRLVSYDWEKGSYSNFFDKQKIWKKERLKLDTYNTEYERIKTNLLTQLGKPTTEDTAVQEVKDEDQKYFARKTFWENGDYKAELNMIFAAATYRIRLTLYWTK